MVDQTSVAPFPFDVVIGMTTFNSELSADAEAGLLRGDSHVWWPFRQDSKANLTQKSPESDFWYVMQRLVTQPLWVRND